MFNLYENIDRLGKACGYTNMTALCSSAGVPRATMTELKMGRSKDLSRPNAEKFAKLLGVSLDEIYGKAPSGAASNTPITDEQLKFALWGDTSEITDKDLEDVRNFAAFIKQKREGGK